MSIRFDGNTSNYLSRTASVPDYNSPYTIAGWLRIKVDTGVTQAAYALSPASASNSFDFFGPESGDLYVLSSRVTDGVIESDNGSAVVYDQWVYFAAVRNSATDLRVYLDLVQDAQVTIDVSTRTAADICTVGRLSVNGGAFIPLDAETAYYRVWTTNLSLVELTAEKSSPVAVKSASLFGDYPMVNAASAGNDISGNGNHFTVNGTISTGASEPALGNRRTLLRGRNFHLFDDSEVNRFEFWPAITAATAHERAVAVSASGDIASAGELFSVFERAMAVAAAGSIASAGEFLSIFERASVVDATATVSTVAEFYSILESAVAIDSTGLVAASGARVVESSSALDGVGLIAVSGESFTLVESAATISGTASIESSGVAFSVSEAAVALDATASIATAGMRIVARSVSLDGSANIFTTAESFSILEQAVTIDAVASIETSATSFSVFDGTATISASAAIESSGVGFSVAERASAIDSIAAITVSGTRLVDRSFALTTTAQISASSESFSVLERSTALTATSSIESAAQFFSTLERSVAFGSVGAITTSKQTEQSRQADLSTTASISVSGNVIPPDAVEHERSVTIDATGGIESSAVSFSTVEGAIALTGASQIVASGLTIRERSTSLTAVTTIASHPQRDLQRTATLTAAGAIDVAFTISGGAAIERAASLNAAATITVNYTIPRPTPPRRTFMVESTQRTTFVKREREYLIADTNRTDRAI